jgi:hypothetical protein
MWNSVISTRGARYMCADASDFYLATPLERNQYMQIAINLIPQELIDLYQLQNKVNIEVVYCVIVRRVYGLTESGVLDTNCSRHVY